MKERPILFSAPMVRAILDGQKTQTRRTMKHQPIDVLPMQCEKQGREWVILEQREPEPKGKIVRCRLGVPGDLLWVRETHQLDPPDDGTWAYVQWSGCRDSTWRDIPARFQNPKHVIYAAEWEGSGMTWRPSIFMPRWASRISLRITDVRVERLHEITEGDAIAEGSREPALVPIVGASWSEREVYAKLWEHINGKGSWKANPWVWVISFERVK